MTRRTSSRRCTAGPAPHHAAVLATPRSGLWNALPRVVGRGASQGARRATGANVLTFASCVRAALRVIPACAAHGLLADASRTHGSPRTLQVRTATRAGRRRRWRRDRTRTEQPVARITNGTAGADTRAVAFGRRRAILVVPTRPGGKRPFAVSEDACRRARTGGGAVRVLRAAVRLRRALAELVDGRTVNAAGTDPRPDTALARGAVLFVPT